MGRTAAAPYKHIAVMNQGQLVSVSVNAYIHAFLVCITSIIQQHSSTGNSML